MRTIFFILTMTLANGAFADEDSGTEVGQRPPEYPGRSTDGNKLHVADVTGQILIVTFWAYWCAPCLKELPVLNTIQKTVARNASGLSQST